MKEFRIPFFGSFTADSCVEQAFHPNHANGNFMWHGMTAFHWFRQSQDDIRRTIKDLQDILEAKETAFEVIAAMISDFDWSHMYSDDSNPTRRQAERNKKFNELIAKCPDDICEGAYRMFIKAYVDYAPHGKAPISYVQFRQGVTV